MGPNKIHQLTPNPHPAATLIKHMRVHGVPIKSEWGMKKQELTRAFRYVTHSSATKETTFVRTKRAEQAPPHSPTLDIPPRSHPATRQKPCLMYDFFLCGLNKAVTQVAQKEERRFGKAIYRVIYCILAAPPQARPHVPQQSGYCRCIHAHRGPPRGYPIFGIPISKIHTRGRPTSRVSPFNTHGVCRIFRLLLRNHQDGQGPHT